MLFASLIYGQLSPGDLANSHADLEGLSNCTKCHEFGKKVTNKKCLDCHDDIQSLLNQKRGLHANADVVKKNCFDCHSDHHGRNFDMIRFDEDNFNHNNSGYELEGQHKIIDCRDCHVSEYIQDTKIKKRADTFLGLEQDCLSCHDDFHQQTLDSDCKSCHNMDEFSPATAFDHEETDYQLKGKHAEVDCVECHKKTTRNGVDFQEFSDILFNDCKSCHEDPHAKQIPGKCMQCHTETSFSYFKGQGRFNHKSTKFNLKGSHKKAACFSCHNETSNPKLVFQDKKGVDENNCIACHSDKHEGKYGTDCAKCHSEKSFLALNDMDFFDHSVADYPLTGKHIEVDCKQCHKESYSKPIDFSACQNCHDDYHRGEFKVNDSSPDCNTCHSLENGFDYSLFTLEQHQETVFPLSGAHYATPCFTCHISEDDQRWTFRDIGINCVDCHQDIHKGFISENYYPENDCSTCHSDETWREVTFNHNDTDWPLEGKHAEVNCSACHFSEKIDNETIRIQKFKDLDTKCVFCHENIHGDAFAIEGITDCKRCHVTNSWFPENFNHNTTKFPLEGKHAEIACADCHTSILENGEIITVYKIKKFECIDCH